MVIVKHSSHFKLLVNCPPHQLLVDKIPLTNYWQSVNSKPTVWLRTTDPWHQYKQNISNKLKLYYTKQQKGTCWPFITKINPVYTYSSCQTASFFTICFARNLIKLIQLSWDKYWNCFKLTQRSCLNTGLGLLNPHFKQIAHIMVYLIVYVQLI